MKSEVLEMDDVERLKKIVIQFGIDERSKTKAALSAISGLTT